MTADSAAKGIRSVDQEGSIGMIADEPVPPYNRPPLSKGLWKGKPLAGIWRKTDGLGVDMINGRKAVSLDPVKHEVVDDQGTVYGYEKLLLATGGTPRRHPASGADPIYFRTLDDYRKLRALADEKQNFIVVGGGFIGSEIAAALALNGKQVVMTFLESGICGAILPPELCELVSQDYESKGVNVIKNSSVTEMKAVAGGVQVCLKDGRVLSADAVVAGLGIIPNTDLAARAGLTVGNGIVVDSRLQTSHADIFAAGDVACFPCVALNKQVRLEHEDNANAMGKLAGRNMAGVGEEYSYLPYFYSDLFKNGYEAIGETMATHRMEMEWVDPGKTGVVFYLNENQVRGVLLWNIFGKVDAARELIMSPSPCRNGDLKEWVKARLFSK